jgi:hypothetical protein
MRFGAKMSFDGWWDNSGMVHVREGEYSENGPLFTAEYWMLRLLSDQLSVENKQQITSTINNIIQDGWYNPNPNDENEPDCHFSHDNMTGLYVLHKLAGLDCNNLPTSKWNERWWLHPRDIAFYTLMKENLCSKLFTIPLLLLLLGASLVSCSANRGRTSGKMMWWLRWKILSLHTSRIVSVTSKISWWICEKILKKVGHPTPVMVDVSAIYFKEVDHPVNELMRELHGIQ